MTTSSSSKKNNFLAAELALSDVSGLLSRLAKSRKAGMRLEEIIDLTREVARLARALTANGSERDDNDGYGNREYAARMSAMDSVKRTGIR